MDCAGQDMDYGGEFVLDVDGPTTEPEQRNHFPGVYLPLMLDYNACSKDALFVCYRNGRLCTHPSWVTARSLGSH